MSKKTVLERYNEMNKTQPTMQWVSVEERYPEVGDLVLVIDKYGFVKLALSDDEVYFKDAYELWDLDDVKYWCKIEMPIIY